MVNDAYSFPAPHPPARPVNRPVSRRTLLFGIGGAGLTAFAAGVGGTLYKLGQSVVTPYLAEFAKQFAMNHVEHGLDWVLKQGLDKLKEIISDETPEEKKKTTPADEAYHGIGGTVFGVHPVTDLTADPRAAVIAENGERITLMPRAAEALARTFNSLTAPGNGLRQYSNDDAANLLYPVRPLASGAYPDGHGYFLRYQSRQSHVEVIYDRSTPVPTEWVKIRALKRDWPYTVGPNRSRLA